MKTRDDERFVRLGDPPHHSPEHKERQKNDNDDTYDHRDAGEKRIAHRYLTSWECRPSGQANDNRARREILHDEDASTPRNGIFWIHGVGVERLTAAADRHLHLPQPARSDGCRYETHSANDLLVTHGCTLIIPRFPRA